MRSRRFLLIFALAYAGVVVAYLPLLTLLLPIKVGLIAPHTRLGLLTLLSLAGAVAASASNILFGWLSDRSIAAGGSRRPWIRGGIAATILSYVAVRAADSPLTLLLAIMGFQLAVNAVLAPLMASIADEVPDQQKGVTGGLLALAHPAASAVTALLVASDQLGESARLTVVCAVFAMLIAPLALTSARVARPDVDRTAPPPDRRDLALAWTARLLVQTSGVILSVFVLLYFQSIGPDLPVARVTSRVGRLLAVAFTLALPLAVAAGTASDRLMARKPFLVGAAGLTAVGLATMAFARDWPAAAAGFTLYACASAVFFSLNTAHAMQLLPSPLHRGRDLGLINLANTIPALIGPVLAWLLATPESFRTLYLVLAAGAFAAGLVILPVRHQR